MNAIIFYLAKVIAIQAILYVIYRMVFHQSGRHEMNRFFILLALLSGFIIPFISVPHSMPGETIIPNTAMEYPMAHSSELILAEIELIPTATAKQSVSYWPLIFLLIPLLSFLFLTRLVIGYIRVHQLKSKSILVKKSWYKLFMTNLRSPFSLFRNIYLPKEIFESDAYPSILRHECVHVAKWHSLDRLLIEILIALFWFNPLLYLYRRIMIETHEFEADEAAIDISKDRIGYQEILYRQLSTDTSLTIVNHFNFSTIKQRIKMMNKTKKQSTWIYSIALPAVIFMLVIFSDKTEKIQLEPISEQFVKIMNNSPEKNNAYKPSVFPLKNADGVVLASGFGIRIHPVLKTKKMHNGVDFKTGLGNPVIATAKGVVLEAGEKGNYGLCVVIDHNGQYKTIYSNLSEILVLEGDQVNTRDEIALSGNSGISTGPHLHYEVIEADSGHVDPIRFIKDYDFAQKSARKIEKGEDMGANSGSVGKKFKVIIDPGHGGKDEGTHSSGLPEKDIVLQIAQKLKKEMSNMANIEIVLTRESDQILTLAERVSQTKGAEMFISLHLDRNNDMDKEAIIPFYLHEGKYSDASEKLANIMMREFAQANYPTKLAYSNGFYVLKNAACTPLLLNLGYVSNTKSDQYLNSEKGQTEMATLIANGIKKALS